MASQVDERNAAALILLVRWWSCCRAEPCH